jgi:hypothetical protein
MTTTLGNHIPPRGLSTGSGRAGMRTPYGRVTVSGKAGEVKIIPISDIVSLNGPDAKFVAQAITGEVAIQVTLAPPDLATNPANTTIWVNNTAVQPGAIVALPFVGTAYKVIFTNDATVYIMGC